MSDSRPSWESYFLQMAMLVATRATCPRRKVGAVLVREERILATGYNGAVRGAPHCGDVGCILVPSGDREHCVRAVHAEMNALLQCAYNGVSSRGSRLYCTDFPCVSCAKAIIQAGVSEVIYLADYPDENSLTIFEQGGVRVRRGHLPVSVPSGAASGEGGREE